MSLDKAIEHNKEHRHKYYGSASVDAECRNHGSCKWCRDNRTHKNRVQEERMKDDRATNNATKV